MSFSKGKQEVKTQVQEPKAQPSGLNLTTDDIFVQHNINNKEEVLRFIADCMLKNGYVCEDYFKALINRENQVSTYLINGVAIPHGVKESKHLVKKAGFVVVQLPHGVVWNEKAEMVHLTVGIAANGKEHLEILSKLATVVMERKGLAKKLGTTATAQEIAEVLNGKFASESSS